MDIETTWWLIVIGLMLALAAIAGDRARRKAPLAWHAHLPWNALVFAGLAAIIFGAVHITGLWRGG